MMVNSPLIKQVTWVKKSRGAATPRPELLANITVYLCNNGIRFMKKFYPSALYFSSSLQF